MKNIFISFWKPIKNNVQNIVLLNCLKYFKKKNMVENV